MLNDKHFLVLYLIDRNKNTNLLFILQVSLFLLFQLFTTSNHNKWWSIDISFLFWFSGCWSTLDLYVDRATELEWNVYIHKQQNVTGMSLYQEITDVLLKAVCLQSFMKVLKVWLLHQIFNNSIKKNIHVSDFWNSENI